MFKFLIERPISVIVTFLGFIILGIVTVTEMPVSALPDIQLPQIVVKGNFPGQSARSINRGSLKLLAVQLQQIYGIKKLSTESLDGSGTIKLQFEFGADLDKAFIEVNEKLEIAMSTLPANTERPRVVKSSATDLPVFFVNLSLKDNGGSAPENRLAELSDFAENVVKKRLEQLPEIAFADLSGADKRAVFLSPKKDVQESFSLEVEDLKAILNQTLLDYGSVDVSEGGKNFTIDIKEENSDGITQIGEQDVDVHGRVFKLGDLMDIRTESKVRNGLFLSNNRHALTFAVIKQPQVSMGDLRVATTKVVDELSKAYPNVEFEITQDQTAILDYAIKALKQDLIVGSVFAFAVLLYFFADIRRALLIFITIPVSLLISLLFFRAIGITLNIISLAGLIVGVGLMIDNSIIVIDSISSRLGQYDLEESCVKGVATIVRPMIASAFTTCSVFLPLVFLSGIAGELFYDQAIAVSVSLFVSIFVTAILLPVLFKLTHSGFNTKNAVSNAGTRFDIFQTVYEMGFLLVFRYKKIALLLTVVIMVAGILLFSSLGKERLPKMTENEYELSIKWGDNISIDENTARVRKILGSVPRGRIVSSARIGQQQFMLDHEPPMARSDARLYFKATSKLAAELNLRALTSYFRKYYPDVSIRLAPPANIFEQLLGNETDEFTIKIGTISGTTPAVAQVDSVISVLQSGIHDLRVEKDPEFETIVFTIDRVKAGLFRVPMDEVYSAIKKLCNTDDLGMYGPTDSQVSVLFSRRQFQDVYSGLEETTVSSERKNNVVLSKFVKVSKSVDFQRIGSENGFSYIRIALVTKDPDMIKKLIEKKPVIGDVKIDFEDRQMENLKLVKEMVVVALVAIALLYLILAAQFNSLLQPAIVLCELPIGMSGGLALMWLCSTTINLMSLIGLVVMCGIIINDSILKVDAINQILRTSNTDLLEAISIAGKKRLRSILMTAMVTIISVVPFLFGSDIASKMQKPLSLAIVGGMLIGTPVSLYILPLLFWYCYKNKYKKT